MRTVFLALVLTVLTFSGLSERFLGFDFTETAIAQEVAAPTVEAAPAVEVVDKQVTISAASDLEESKLEIPAWIGAVVEFIKTTPYVGPYVVKALAFCGIIAAILTLLATILMGVSGIITVLTKGKATPKWLVTVNKWLDYAIKVAKYLSMYNVQKEEKK